jgi:NADPH:quinone reductase-like Zn-dependent oxidoreductase
MSHLPTVTVLTEIELPGPVEPAGLVVRSAPIPAPRPGRVIVRMEATGVSFAEQQMRRGKYYEQPTFPFVPGYDLVGTVDRVAADVPAELIGQRVAAVTKTGAWATHVEVDARDLLPIPQGLDVAEVETVIVNGITAWQMLHDIARIASGATIVVLGGNGGVGSTLIQLARSADIRVIATASVRHHALLRALGAEPVDAADAGMYSQIRALAPEGVDGVFDHIGGRRIRDSWSLLRRGGALVSYGTASTKNDAGNSQLPVLRLFARLSIWNVLPNGRRASFYNFWAGQTRRPASFRKRQASAFARVVSLLAAGTLRPQIAARFPLRDAASALTLAESRTVAGKVILLGD